MTKELNNSTKVKNLTITELKKQAKKLDSTNEVFITVGDLSYAIKIDEKFRRTKIVNLLDDMVKLFDHSTKNTELLNLTTPYISLLIIKHFTSLDVPDDVESALDLLHVLIDLEIVSVILNAMPEDQLVKVYELIDKTFKQLQTNLEDAEEEYERLANEVQSEQVKEMYLDVEKTE